MEIDCNRTRKFFSDSFMLIANVATLLKFEIIWDFFFKNRSGNNDVHYCN